MRRAIILLSVILLNIYIVNAISSVETDNIHSNVITDFNPEISSPEIEHGAYIHPHAVLIGDCYIGEEVMVSPTAVCRGDEGTPLHVGDYSNLQDGVIIHSLESTQDGENIDGRRFTEDGERLNGDDPRFEEGYAVYISEKVSCAHGSQVHGPAWVGHDTFIGMETLIFNAKVGSNVAIGVGSTITGGVEIPDGRYVPPGSVIDTQAEADALGPRIGSPYEGTNAAVVHVNENLAIGYADRFTPSELVKNYRKIQEIETGLGSVENEAANLLEDSKDIEDNIEDMEESLTGKIDELRKHDNRNTWILYILFAIVFITTIVLFNNMKKKLSEKEEELLSIKEQFKKTQEVE